MATVRIVRPSKLRGVFRTIAVAVDGVPVGGLTVFKPLIVQVPPGQHTVTATVGSSSATPLVVDIPVDRTVTVSLEIAALPLPPDASANSLLTLRQSDA